MQQRQRCLSYLSLACWSQLTALGAPRGVGFTALDSQLPAVASARSGAVHCKAAFLALCGFLCVLKACVGTCINNAKATARVENYIRLVPGQTAHFSLDNTRV